MLMKNFQTPVTFALDDQDAAGSALVNQINLGVAEAA